MPLPWFVQQRAQYYRQQAYARFVRGLASFVLVRIGWASSLSDLGPGFIIGLVELRRAK